MLGKRIVRKRSGVRAWSKTQENRPFGRLSMDTSFCPTSDKWFWPTTSVVVTQTHPSCFAQKSLSVLCRVFSHSRTRKLKRAHGVLNGILVNYAKGKRKANPEVASR